MCESKVVEEKQLKTIASKYVSSNVETRAYKSFHVTSYIPSFLSGSGKIYPQTYKQCNFAKNKKSSIYVSAKLNFHKYWNNKSVVEELSLK